MGNKKMLSLSNLIFLCLSVIFFQSCSSYADWELPEYDGELDWVQITDNADWDKRWDHEVAVLNDELYVVGGYNPGVFKGDPYYEDVWKTSDGESWMNVTSDAPWLGRKGHALVTFDDGTGEAMYLIGGFSVDESTEKRQYNNDVWRSTDGENWTAIVDSANWYPRMHHKTVVANHGGQDYIYLIGGYTMREDMEGRYGIKYFNDVWRSTDGINWSQVNNTDIGIRAEHALAVDENGTLYMQGGQHGVIFESDDSSGGNPIAGYGYLWTSTDGENWTNTSDSVLIAEGHYDRTSHEMIYYEGKVWALPGKTNSLNHYSFTSRNHITTWTVDMNGDAGIDSRGIAIDARHNYASIVWRNQIWVLGGNTNRNGQDNDVWAGSL